MKIAFQGEPGAYSELAAKEFFGVSKKYLPVPEFGDVYTMVASGKVQHGILPIENSLAGSIHQNYDILLKGDLSIIGEIYLKVSHYLIANEGVKRKNIKRVYSHPQALAQCKNYLRKFKNLQLIPVSNTASAVRMIKKEKLDDAAAIASMQAAIDYNMAVFGKRIEDVKNNQTRFIMLGKKALQIKSRRKKAKTSIVFTLKNIPGALFRALSVFALRDIDLYKIESRPVHGRNFEYMFYLDFDGNIDSGPQQNAVNHLREITSFERILGSYYVGNVVHPIYQKR